MNVKSSLFILLAVAMCSCSSDNSGNQQRIVRQKAGDKMRSFHDGWPPGLPKDTTDPVVYEKDPDAIQAAIVQQAHLHPDLKNVEPEMMEVYRDRAWDGEKWYPTENAFAALVKNKQQPEQKWIVGIEKTGTDYRVTGWYNK